ncbi:TPA: fimbria/pilus outer membrane usher protein [Klebsiella variicola]|uniref:fimbria/pilus outer membrane usher protein n=2 Tax=Klebsiella variicola TaxID=244366 RepID=UPI0003BF2FC1|nr:fimbria/pilus outer membrane usher protein [Klebsiella variicola]MBC4035252.1 fimbrial biogenesis outer membrane usher protein [Klebsiella pneumoniae]HED1714212.1 fimbrial biogenesis outer membrane usher protein [Klebsiella variicola subsp. variicola]ESN31298.1 hypothetical protein L366_05294 [Klebsiella variicola]MBC5038355.1 fimbrial biogenesis outer membrane usher protein [Klebsiella variicola]MBD0722780.1 fimbrial biogenesis outer membrane usher protein [Klebsiella variicola]
MSKSCHWSKQTIVLVLLVTWQVRAQEYDTLPDAPHSVASVSSFTYYLTLSVNGRVDTQVIPVLYRNGHYVVEAGALTRNDVRLGTQRSGLIDVSELPQVKTEYDEAHQQLKLTVPTDWLPVQDVTSDSMFSHVQADSTPGMLINYDAYYLKSYAGSQTLSVWLEPRLFSNYGYLTSTGTWRRTFIGNDSDVTDGYLRYDTFWRYSDEDRMISYQLGDFVSDSLTWSNSVRMGGLRISRNFGVRPDLVTYPLLQYSGTSAVPSSVDLFINGYKASSSNLNAGPYTLTNVPYINGSGEATVVTTDALGRQVVTSIPFYVSNILLREGLSDFDVSLGQLRSNYGVRNSDYAHSSSSLIYRYGLTNYLTLSGHSELSDGLTLGGLGSDIAIGRWGTFSNSYSQDGNQGQRYTLGYSYYSHWFSIAIQHSQRTNGYQDLSTFRTTAQLSHRSDQATFSTSPFGSGNGTLGIGYFDIQSYDNSRTRLANISYSRPIWGNSSLNLSLNKTLGDSGYSSQLQLIIPFGTDSTASAQLQRDTNGNYAERFLLSKNAPSDGGIGWNLGYSTGSSHYRQADMTWKTSYATMQGGVYGDSGDENYWGDLKGSLVYMDNALFAANKVNDGFVVVSTDGYSDVPVRYENRLMGKTDRQGYLLVPWANAYYPAQVEIDTLNLPLDADAEVVEKKIAVREGSGALVSFPVKTVRSASIHLVDKHGKPLPIGSVVTELNSGQSSIVGYDGLVFLTHLPRDNSLSVQLINGGQCRQSFTLPDRTVTPIQIESLTCDADLRSLTEASQ